jgi:hypothetical protein
MTWSRGLEYRGLLLTVLEYANTRDKYFAGVLIKRGEFACSMLQFSKKLGISRCKLLRMFSILRADEILNTKPNNKFTIVTICNYNLYNPPTDDNRTTNDTTSDTTTRTTDEHQVNNDRTLLNNDKNDNNDNSESLVLSEPPKAPARNQIGQAEASEIVSRWNTLATEFGLCTVQKLSPKRTKALNARKKDGMIERLEEVFSRIKASPFLQGLKPGIDWRADFDFVFCSTNNWLKILEGKYNDRTEENKRAITTPAKFAGRD